MFGTLFFDSTAQHSTQYVRHIVTDVKVSTKLKTSINSYFRVVQQGLLHYENCLAYLLALPFYYQK